MSGHLRLSKSLLLRDFLCHDLGLNLECARERTQRAEKDAGAASAASSGEFVEAVVKATDARGLPEHVKSCAERALAACRQAGFAPRYFQFLALTLAAHYWQRAAQDEAALLAAFTGFYARWSEQRPAASRVGAVDAETLQVTAFWLATGAGKTHLLHASLVLLADQRWDRILLITPNETLSRQHAERLCRARVAPVLCYPDDGDASAIADASADTVIVIDLAKLRFEKTGEGVTLDARDFAGKRNLVLVDEGHKGQKSDESTWKAIQRQLAGIGADQPRHRGMLIEFSATFGQVVEKEGSFDFYAKSVVFDYPYDRFHGDGYGKDFRVANAVPTPLLGDEAHEPVLAAALLAFALQRERYRNESVRREWSDQRLAIEPPLWLLLGAKVVGKKPTQDEETQLSDVVKVLCFLKMVLSPEGVAWLARRFESLNAASGLREEHIAWKNAHPNAQALAEHVRELVFGYQASARFVARRLREAGKELGLGLEVQGTVRYFGVVNVGEVSALAEKLQSLGWEMAEESLRGSLFQRINQGDPDLTLLIGSRMFAEGWDSYRASSLTLLQLGAKEGPLVIQMFGRVIRFAGAGGDMKRLDQPSEALRPLQTAYVFGLKADYLNRFLEGLKANGLPTEIEDVELRIMDEAVRNRLILPVNMEAPLSDFAVDARGAAWLASFPVLSVVFDTGVKMVDGQFAHDEVAIGNDITVRFQRLTPLLDKRRLMQRLLAFRSRKGWWNLKLDATGVEAALISGRYALHGPTELLRLDSQADLARIEDLAATVLEKMLQKAHSLASSPLDRWVSRAVRPGEAFPNKLQRLKVQA